MSDDNLFCTECGRQIPQGNACPHCGAPMNDGDVFCQNCGKKPDEAVLPSAAPSSLRVCPHCGATMSDDDIFCQNCGKRPNEPAMQTPYQSVSYAEEGSSVNWGKVLSIILSIILVVGLGVGGYFAYSDYSEKKAREEARIKAERAEQEKEQRLAELDAADWERATSDNSEQGYQEYINNHSDGKHAIEAQEKLDRIMKQKLSDGEAYDVRNTIESFFNSVSAGEEDDMLRCISPVMENFLGKANATKVDAVSFMRRMHADDVYSIHISLDSSEIQISKSLGDSDTPTYSANFSYDQRIEREDTSKETFASISGHAVLNDDFKITSLSLKKVSSY